MSSVAHLVKEIFANVCAFRCSWHQKPYLPKPGSGGSTATGRISTIYWEDLMIHWKFHAQFNKNFCFLKSFRKKRKIQYSKDEYLF